MVKQTDVQKQETRQKSAVSQQKFIPAVGRRREAVARVRLYPTLDQSISWGDALVNKGDIFVNGKQIDKYFSGAVAQAVFEEPLRLTNMLGKCTLTVQVEGGGKHGQLEAVVHGIAKVLDVFDREKFHSLLRKKGYLTRDARARERRKVGTGGKARREKQSPKR